MLDIWWGNIEIFLLTNYKNPLLIKGADYLSTFIFYFRYIFMYYCPGSLFCYWPVIRIDACMISEKMTFSLNFINYHIFAIYVGGASSELPDVCRLIAVSGARLPSFDGLAVSCIKCTAMLNLQSQYVYCLLQICLRYIYIYIYIYIYLYANTQGLWSCAFAYMWLRHQGFT